MQRLVLGARVGAIRSKLLITTVPPSDENQLRREAPPCALLRLMRGMWVYCGPQLRQPIAPLVQCGSPGTCSVEGGRCASPFTAGQRPDARTTVVRAVHFNPVVRATRHQLFAVGQAVEGVRT